MNQIRLLKDRKRVMKEEAKDLKNDIRVLKVSVVYIIIICSVVRSFCLYPITGSCENMLSACRKLFGVNFEAVLI